MSDYMKSYKGAGRLSRYYQFLLNTTPNREQLLQEALDYCQETSNLGGFARIREIMSSEMMISEPEWRVQKSAEAFQEHKVFAERLTKLCTSDERAKILYEQAERYEYYGEYQKAIKCCTDALEDLKNKELIAEACYRLVRLNVFLDQFHQGINYLDQLKNLIIYTGEKYKRFICVMDFLYALRNPDTFSNAFEMIDRVLIFGEKNEWEFNEFLSFEDIALYGVLVGLLTQTHKRNVEKLVTNAKFRNHADCIPELTVLLENYKSNNFALICQNVKSLEKYFRCNLYFGQNLANCISTIKSKCYIEYIFAYSVVDMKLMSEMFGDSLNEVESALEEYIYNDTIKAKIDATTHTLHFVEGDERYNAYIHALKAVTKAINLSQEIVLKADAMFDF